MSTPYYPNAHGRRSFTRDEALDRWPVARTVYEELQRTGPASAARLARRLHMERGAVEDVLWWLTFGDDNGFGPLVHGHDVTWGSGDGRRITRLRFVHCIDLELGCQITDALVGHWSSSVDAEDAR